MTTVTRLLTNPERDEDLRYARSQALCFLTLNECGRYLPEVNTLCELLENWLAQFEPINEGEKK